MSNSIVITSTNKQEVLTYRDDVYNLLRTHDYTIGPVKIECTADAIRKLMSVASLTVEPIRYATEHTGEGFSVIYFKYIKYNGIGMGWNWGLFVRVDDNNLAVQLKLIAP
jgi:hypothetical protein